MNFKRLAIIKLESCLSCYSKDSSAWELMDSFLNYASFIEEDLMDNISKLYLGKKMMVDIGAVEDELRQI